MKQYTVIASGKATGRDVKHNKIFPLYLDYNDLKTELTTFLQQYAVEGKVRTDPKINNVL